MLVDEELLVIFHSSIRLGNASLSFCCQFGTFLRRILSSVSSLKQIGLGSSAFSSSGCQRYLLFSWKGMIFVGSGGILPFKHINKVVMLMYKKDPQILTIACKLVTNPQHAQDFDNLSLIFAATCNYINASVNPKHKSAIKIQKLIYADAKIKSGMQANHVIQACIRVAGNRKVAEVLEFKPGSVLYDARTFSLARDLKTVSLSVLNKRIKVPTVLGDYQREMLDMSRSEPSSATLVGKNGEWYLHIQVKVNAKIDNPRIVGADNYLGVDLGRKDIASLSNGTSFSGEDIEKVRTKYSRIRARLQHKAKLGTRSSRRRTRQLQKRLAQH